MVAVSAINHFCIDTVRELYAAMRTIKSQTPVFEFVIQLNAQHASSEFLIRDIADGAALRKLRFSHKANERIEEIARA